MAHINLLPWRERLREERKREFLTILVGIVIIGAGLLFLVDRYFNGEIDSQTARNEFLRSEIRILDEQVAEIATLRAQKEDIRDRMNVITDLQGTRPVIVRVFDEMVKTLPEGVFYETVSRQDNVLSIEGFAESYAQITQLLRRLNNSEWFGEPELGDISAVAAPAEQLSQLLSFSITLNLELPNAQDDEV